MDITSAPTSAVEHPTVGIITARLLLRLALRKEHEQLGDEEADLASIKRADWGKPGPACSENQP